MSSKALASKPVNSGRVTERVLVTGEAASTERMVKVATVQETSNEQLDDQGKQGVS
jgi:hypothetical protein